MTLLIDVGNSAVKWARLTPAGELCESRWLLHRNVADVDVRLAELWLGDSESGDEVVACNVAGPDRAAAIENAARALQLGAVRWLHSQQSFDGPILLLNGYCDPLQLGADRWHCMLGACSIADAKAGTRAMVVVNAGTATTVDCIDSENSQHGAARFTGRFIGGVIAPGVRLMLDSLERGTAGLPSVAGSSSHFPDNTDDAIVTGVLDAQSGLVERVWCRFAERLKTEPRLILTGGSAAGLLGRLSIKSAVIEHNLVLRGLALRAQFDVDDLAI